MRWARKLVVRRVVLYLTISILGLSALTGVYCALANRHFLEVLGNLWIAFAFALVTAALTAVKDHRNDQEEL